MEMLMGLPVNVTGKWQGVASLCELDRETTPSANFQTYILQTPGAQDWKRGIHFPMHSPKSFSSQIITSNDKQICILKHVDYYTHANIFFVGGGEEYNLT